MSFPAFGPPLKSNMLFNVPVVASVEPLPIRPRFQLSSMNRKIEDWSVIESSMKFCFAQGEITSSGNRGPKPQRPFCVPPLTSFAFGEPQLPGPSNWSSDTFDWVTMVPIWCSYQPSESSQEIMTAVSFQSFDCMRALMTLTTKICSSIGSE